METTLIFQLQGIMGSWGGLACGEKRLSHNHPTHSALIGLLAAAKGINRNDKDIQDAMSIGYHFAIKAWPTEGLLEDFHTAQVRSGNTKAYTRTDELTSKKLNTIISWRDYCLKMYYQIAVYANENAPFNLNELKESLLKPKYTLYLGRKSCPLCLPLHPQVIESGGVIEAFEKAEFIDIEEHEDTIIYCDKSLVEESDIKYSYLVRDIPDSRKQWTFFEREECVVNYVHVKNNS